MFLLCFTMGHSIVRTTSYSILMMQFVYVLLFSSHGAIHLCLVTCTSPYKDRYCLLKQTQPAYHCSTKLCVFSYTIYLLHPLSSSSYSRETKHKDYTFTIYYPDKTKSELQQSKSSGSPQTRLSVLSRFLNSQNRPFRFSNLLISIIPISNLANFFGSSSCQSLNSKILYCEFRGI